ncbi:MAG: helix-turn-helix domain-containing protein [Nostocaceae cyanobacterium]|nr:helix-turn-helix domain-containing protein [Nostocaceae cyanobacterium]
MSQSFNQDKVFENFNQITGKFLTPFQRKALLKNLQGNLQSEYRRRIEIMLLADAGNSQTQICETLGCSQEMARYWMAIAKAGLAHTWREKPIGRPKTVNDKYLQRLRELVINGPREYGYSFQYWTGQWLSKHLAQELGIEIGARHINRLLKKMGLSTRPKRQKEQIMGEEMNKIGIKIQDLQSKNQPIFRWSFNRMQVNS